MHYTIEKLMFSNEPIQESFINARGKWKELFKDIETVDIEELAKRLTSEQMWFEHNCGSRYPGQEVMAWSAFGFFYTTANGFEGNEDLVKKLDQAFKKSHCSLEVKGHADRAAQAYYVNER